MSDPTTTPATGKGQRRRQGIVAAAAEILREHGPQAVSRRTVAS